MHTRAGVKTDTDNQLHAPAAAHVSMTILVKSWEARPFCRITCRRFCGVALMMVDGVSRVSK